MSFARASQATVADAQLRRNLRKATGTIRAKRAAATDELPDWQELRDAGRAIKDAALSGLPMLLEQLETRVAAAGGQVHWARDGHEANEIVRSIAARHGVDELVKVKSMATDEIKLNDALSAAGIQAIETDLAELIIQLGDDVQSHILVPAIHRNRAEIREVLARALDRPDLTDEPAMLAGAVRDHLRAKFLSARMAVSGANFAVAETGAVAVFESEGNGRMCTTLPEVLVTVMGVEKLVPAWADMAVFTQLLPRSSTGERMNPYTSFWTGVTPGDGPQEFHLVLLDNGRTGVLADRVGRQALRCIRCSACLNSCPVYARSGGHAYESVYPGPIGAILAPQLSGLRSHRSLPFASTLCGACYDVCPVAIDIPQILVHLRNRIVADEPAWTPDRRAMSLAWRALRSQGAYERAQRALRAVSRLSGPATGAGGLAGPLSAWSANRDLPAVPAETFREWWRRERGQAAEPAVSHEGAVPPPRSAVLALDPAGADARSSILLRIRRALGTAGDVTDPVPRAYRQRSGRAHAEVVDLFAERMNEYRADVHRADLNDIVRLVERLCRARGVARMGIPVDLPVEWRPQGVDLVEDRRLDVAALDALDGAITGCALGIAETGVVVLDGGTAQGRRSLSLVPDYHLCVVAETQLVDLVPEAFSALAPAARAGRPLTFVAGPSATSDIELERVEGVHGPRTLDVIVLLDDLLSRPIRPAGSARAQAGRWSRGY